MLKSLSVRNFALVEELTLGFGAGLNIITGETGAGKSIIVDALMMALGERASADMVRAGEQKAVVEGIFDITGNMAVNRLLAERDYDGNDTELILRRELSAKGSYRSFVNDSPAPAGFVREIGNALVDFHGQHDHQSLLRAEQHCGLVDDAGGLAELRAEYSAAFVALQEQCRSLTTLLGREQALRQERDFKQFQCSELEQLEPLAGEFEALESELSVIENAEKIHEAATEIYNTLYGDDDSIRDRLVKVQNLLGQLRGYDPAFDEYVSECRQAIVSAEEIAKFSQDYKRRLDFSPGRIEFIRDRLKNYARLRKKYGENLAGLLESLRKELALSENFNIETERIRTEIAMRRRMLGNAATRLSVARRETAAFLESGIATTLQGLGIPNAVFHVVFDQFPMENVADEAPVADVGGIFFTTFADGIDRVEFYVSMNKGEEPKPLARVASGGEISRVMLAMKGMLAKTDRLPMLVFDEIDAGISGRIARKVGFAMHELAAFHQIIAITHLPQIASLADVHIAVEKTEKDGRAVVSAAVLTPEQRVGEVAKLIGGEAVTAAALGSARELIEADDKQEH